MNTIDLQRANQMAEAFINMLTMYGNNDEAVKSSCLHFQKKIKRNLAHIDSKKKNFFNNRFLIK